MDNTLLLIFLSLVAAIGWGVSGFFDAKASRSVNPLAASLLVNGIVAIGYAAFYALFLHEGFNLSTTGLLYAISGGAIITVGAIAYFKGLHAGPVSLVSPMSSAYPLVTTLLVVFAFQGAITTLQLIAIGLILAGVFTVTELLHVVRKRTVMSRGPLLGLVAAVCWGVGYALVAQAISAIGWQQATLFEFTAMLLAFGICLPLMQGTQSFAHEIQKGLQNSFIWLAGLVALAAATCFNIGLSHDVSSGAIVATISSFYPIITVLLALRHFDEPIRGVQVGGAFVSIAGVILLGIA